MYQLGRLLKQLRKTNEFLKGRRRTTLNDTARGDLDYLIVELLRLFDYLSHIASDPMLAAGVDGSSLDSMYSEYSKIERSLSSIPFDTPLTPDVRKQVITLAYEADQLSDSAKVFIDSGGSQRWP